MLSLFSFFLYLDINLSNVCEKSLEKKDSHETVTCMNTPHWFLRILCTQMTTFSKIFRDLVWCLLKTWFWAHHDTVSLLMCKELTLWSLISALAMPLPHSVCKWGDSSQLQVLSFRSNKRNPGLQLHSIFSPNVKAKVIAILIARIILISSCHGCKESFDYTTKDPFFLSVFFHMCVYTHI